MLTLWLCKVFLALSNLAWILISLLMRRDTPQMPFVLACSAFTRFLVDSIFIFSLSALLPIWTVISLAQRVSFNVEAQSNVILLIENNILVHFGTVPFKEILLHHQSHSGCRSKNSQILLIRFIQTYLIWFEAFKHDFVNEEWYFC